MGSIKTKKIYQTNDIFMIFFDFSLLFFISYEILLLSRFFFYHKFIIQNNNQNKGLKLRVKSFVQNYPVVFVRSVYIEFQILANNTYTYESILELR